MIELVYNSTEGGLSSGMRARGSTGTGGRIRLAGLDCLGAGSINSSPYRMGPRRLLLLAFRNKVSGAFSAPDWLLLASEMGGSMILSTA